jgi:hypothetical protein
MNKQMIKGRIMSCIAGIAIAVCGSLTGCAMPDETESVEQALTLGVAGPFGDNSGIVVGTSSNLTTPLTGITTYASASYIYGIQLHWGTQSVMHGTTNGLQGETLVLSPQIGDFINEVKYYVDTTGKLRGVRFKTTYGTIFKAGWLGIVSSTAFSCTNCALTDMTTYRGTVSGASVIWGIRFNYTSP